MNLKQKFMNAAEVADAWRAIPRIVLGGYGWLIYETSYWYMNLPDPSNSQLGFVSAIVGIAGLVVGSYFKGGRDWQKESKSD